jgi:hypothetical protein
MCLPSINKAVAAKVCNKRRGGGPGRGGGRGGISGDN